MKKNHPERQAIIIPERNITFRSMRRLYQKLLPKSQSYFNLLFRFAIRLMEIELNRTTKKRKKAE